MRRLILIRHAKAVPAGGRDDFGRELAERGVRDAERVGAALAARHAIPTLLIHSGAVRTKQTAAILMGCWPARIAQHEDRRLYNATSSQLIGWLSDLPAAETRVAVVAHNPAIGELAAALVGAGPSDARRRLAEKFPPCATAVVDFSIRRWADIEVGAGTLAFYVTPADLGGEGD